MSSDIKDIIPVMVDAVNSMENVSFLALFKLFLFLAIIAWFVRTVVKGFGIKKIVRKIRMVAHQVVA